MSESRVARTKHPVFANVADLVPADLLDFLEQVASLLPDEFRFRLKRVIDSMPPGEDNLQRILELVLAQWKDLRSDEWVQIAVTGPARTGKSSFLKVVRDKQEEGSPSIFTVVDTQGLDEFLGYGRPAIPGEIMAADVILLLLDARYQLSEDSVEMYQRFVELKKPVLVVLNKIDLVEDENETLALARGMLHSSVFPGSVYRPETIDRLLKAIVSSNSRAIYPLAQSFPGFRQTLCNGIVSQAAFAAGLVGAVPIPVSDLLPISAIQTAMLLKIARAYGFKVNRKRAGELIPLLAGGALIREGSHRLRQRFPHHGKLIGVGVGSVWTYLLGQATIRYFDRLAAFVRSRETDLDRLAATS